MSLVEIHQKDDECLITLNGDLSELMLQEFQSKFASMPGDKHYVLDFIHVSKIYSPGIQIFIKLIDNRIENGDITVINAKSDIKTMLTILQLDKMVHLA